MPRIISVVGARPNFMKADAVHRALVGRGGIESHIVHTGQHYDRTLSDVFFQALDLPAPQVHLGIGSGSHAQQTAGIMVAFERYVSEAAARPALTVVYGDVTSTVAAALVCAKLGIPVAHVEAGLRSFDRSMPEEINRLMTDRVADLLYVSEPAGLENLRREGIEGPQVLHAGNVMIDSVTRHLESVRARAVCKRFDLERHGYALVTLHRPSNVDDAGRLEASMRMIRAMAERLPLVFPVHPRTRQRLQDSSIGKALTEHPCIHLTEPLGYLDFLGLMSDARVVVTDSGGVQEETTYLDIPCITLRTTTERPITVELGTNEIVGEDPERALGAFERAVSGNWKHGSRPPLWDGKAA